MEDLEFIEEENKWLTIDLIIEKFIPIIGAVLLVVWLGYLIYTSVWSMLAVPIRLGIWFIASFAIIYTWNTLTQKLKYFSDVIIGAWILLLYWTLIYGSRSEIGQIAAIPEIGSLIVSFVFTAIIAFFASVRKSNVILILSLIWAYLTPFVIWQQWTWTQNMSFNSFLIYFTSINIVLYQLGKDFSLKTIIPLNIAWLFFGTSSLYALSYKGIELASSWFFAWNNFSALLFLVLALFSIWSIIVTSLEYREKDEGYISFGYVATIFWLILNLNILDISWIYVWIIFLIFGVSAFAGWYYLKENSKSRIQHISLYSIWVFSLIMTFLAFVPELNKYSSLFIVYTSLIFGGLYLYDNSKKERLYAYFGFSFVWALVAINPSVLNDVNHEDIYIILALIPASLSYFITRNTKSDNLKTVSSFYSIMSSIIIAIILLINIFWYLVDFVKLLNNIFIFFYIIPLISLIYISRNKNINNKEKSTILNYTMLWFIVWYFNMFFILLSNIYPAPLDSNFFKWLWFLSDWKIIYGIFAIIISYFWLKISNKLRETKEKNNPTDLFTILFYSSLFVLGNYVIYAIINDLWFSAESGWIRAISATLFWIILAIYMLISWIKWWKEHKTEKFLGLTLLFITVWKIILYDMATMPMSNKIIVLMIAWSLLLSFSYFTHKNKKSLENQQGGFSPLSNKLENIDWKILNKTIKDIDVSDIKSTRFILNNWKSYKIKTKNLFKIVKLIVENFWKTKFKPWELLNTYDNIQENYSSKLSRKDYEKLLWFMKEFIVEWWEVEIIKK